MFFPQLRVSLQFFWQDLTPLLWRLLPLFPLLVFIKYRLFAVSGGDPEKAMLDPAALLLEVMAGLSASAVAMAYTLARRQGRDDGVRALWQQVMPRLPSLFVVQILVGLAIIGGLLLLILPGLYLLGVLMPAYVLVVHEGLSAPAAVRAAWQRFRGRPWELAASFFVVLSVLLLIQGGLESLLALTAAAPIALRILAASGLGLIGLLFAQLVGILLVHTYLAAQEAESRKPPES